MDKRDEPEGLFQVLDGILKPVTPSQAMSLATMLRGWSGDVRRFLAGLHSTPIRDAVIWGADDYVAALTMRSRIEETRAEVPAESQMEFDAWLGEIDADYRGFTEPDDQELLANWLHEEVPGDWWWHRVPASGAVRDDLDQM